MLSPIRFGQILSTQRYALQSQKFDDVPKRIALKEEVHAGPHVGYILGMHYGEISRQLSQGQTLRKKRAVNRLALRDEFNRTAVNGAVPQETSLKYLGKITTEVPTIGEILKGVRAKVHGYAMSAAKLRAIEKRKAQGKRPFDWDAWSSETEKPIPKRVDIEKNRRGRGIIGQLGSDTHPGTKL